MKAVVSSKRTGKKLRRTAKGSQCVPPGGLPQIRMGASSAGEAGKPGKAKRGGARGGPIACEASMPFDIDEDAARSGERPVAVQIRDYLATNATRCIDLFKQWDEDKSGTVDKREFHKAVRALGFEVEKEDTDAVFDSLDDDKSGNLEYAELSQMLRTDMYQLNVLVHRARRQFSKLNMVDAGQLIERRRLTRQLRLGIENLEIAPLL